MYIYTETYSFDFDRLIFCDTSGYALGPCEEKYLNKYIP